MSTSIELLARRFPPDFVFGAATAAYQIEGAHEADGKGASIWDTFCRVPGAILTGEKGDVACDHYRRWREDVALMRDLGLRAYRFSISWPRVLPTGRGKVNEAGVAFYDRLVDALLAADVRPFVTLYHWDLPQALEDRGGWPSPEIVEVFAEYADLLARRLGDRVTDWMTLNEPSNVADIGHRTGLHAPGVRDFGATARSAHHLVLAHVAAASAIHAARPSARVGIALSVTHCDPATDAAADVAAARRWDGYQNRWYLDPLYGRGYPPDMLEVFAPFFARPPEVGPVEPPDFLGVNYYTRRLIKAVDTPLGAERTELDSTDGERTALNKEVHPLSFRKVLDRVRRDYRPSDIFITENGAAYNDVVAGDRVEDPVRISFLERHLTVAADALDAGVPLRGYFVWSLMDNFEWNHGTSKRYGLVHTDYATQRRRIKSSGAWYCNLIAACRSSAGLAVERPA